MSAAGSGMARKRRIGFRVKEVGRKMRVASSSTALRPAAARVLLRSGLLSPG